MKYKSVDETDTLILQDANVVKCIYSDKQGILEFELDGAAVSGENSANDTYTDRYVSDMQLRFLSPDVEAILLEGHSYYDANDVLLEKVPDVPIDAEKYAETLKSFEGCQIFYAGRPKDSSGENADAQAEKRCFQMIIDREDDSYVVSFYYDKAVAQWEHFMNKCEVRI